MYCTTCWLCFSLLIREAACPKRRCSACFALYAASSGLWAWLQILICCPPAQVSKSASPAHVDLCLLFVPHSFCSMFVQLMRTMAANVSGMQAVWQAECKCFVLENQLSTREALGTMLYLSKEAGDLCQTTTRQRNVGPFCL